MGQAYASHGATMNTRTQVEMISLRPEFMYTLYSMTHPYIHLLLAVAKCYTTPTKDSLDCHLYFVQKIHVKIPLPMEVHTTHSQMLGKIEYTLPAKF